jgi:thiol-disulfide isomerase/thioredoxin
MKRLEKEIVILMKRLRVMGLILIALFLLAACSAGTPAAAGSVDEGMAPDTSSASGDEMMEGDSMSEDTASEDMGREDTASEDMGHEDTANQEMGMDAAEAAGDSDMMADTEMNGDQAMTDDSGSMAAMPGELPAWQSLPLTDVRDGASFTLADFAGKTVYVEPMATWCTNCRMQLFNVQQARTSLSEADFVFVGLSVETNLDQASLAQYAQGFGFDWAFAVASPELLQSLVDEFGRAIINPPSTPHFIIRPDGTFGELVTGIDTADQLVSRLQG